MSWIVSVWADQRPPSAVKVLNLSSQPIISFSIQGLPFRSVGLDSHPGDSLTPFFADGAMDYQIYWQLQDRSVHGAAVDLRKELPSAFHGDVLISIHDNRVAVSWSNMDPAWVEYRRVGNPKIFPEPTVPLHIGCGGEILFDPLALKAWGEAAERVRKRGYARTVEEEILTGKCTLDWYVARSPERKRPALDEATSTRLRAEWEAAMEKFKADKSAAQ